MQEHNLPPVKHAFDALHQIKTKPNRTCFSAHRDKVSCVYLYCGFAIMLHKQLPPPPSFTCEKKERNSDYSFTNISSLQLEMAK